MALLTVERSQSVEGMLSSSSEDEGIDENDDENDVIVDSLRPRAPKLGGRMRSPSFAGYFASKGGAVSLPDGNKIRAPTDAHKKPCGELQDHLQRMVTLLREDDSLKMAVRIESQLPDRKRYLSAVTNSNGECILVGIDWASGPTIGLVLELNSTTSTKLDGDGGFHITYESGRTHCFKPVSVQTLWSAMHIIERGVAMATHNGHYEGFAEFLSFYKSRINSDATSISEWNMMDDLMSTTQFDMVTSDLNDSESAAVKKIIRAKLKEVMIKVDIDEVTSREIRQMCEDELKMDLYEYKSFLDLEMFTILGQMDSASKIFDYLFLGSEWNASDLEELQKLGIGHILNLTREIDNFFPDTFVYYNIRVWDEEDTELMQYWDRTYKFIHNAKMDGSKVLVHCRRGISRSASTVIAYLMKSRGWSLTESMDHVKQRRSIVNPNAGFQKQLIIYEGILNSSRNRYSALFRQRSKSDVLRPSLHELRRQFKKAKHSEEVGEEENENESENEKEKEFQQKNADRPKSWTADCSGVNFDSAVDSKKYVAGSTVKTMEMPPLQEDAEDENEVEKEADFDVQKGNEMVDVGINNARDNEGIAEATRPQKKRGLLSRARTLPPQSSPRHWEEMIQKDAKVNDSRVITEAEETKEDNLIKQAVAASVMKTQLLQSLVKLQELRSDEDSTDGKLGLESIIKPSSLRKASSRRRPFERTRSFSDDRSTRLHQGMRERAFTVAHTERLTYDDSIDDDEVQGENLPTDNSAIGEKKTNGITESSAPVNKAEQETSSSAANPATNGGESNIIQTSQFQTVKESAKWYENREKLHAQRIRILRSVRRHTIDSAELKGTMKGKDSGSSRSKSSEGRVASRDQSPSPKTIGKHRTERSPSLPRAKFLAVAAEDGISCQEDSGKTKDAQQQFNDDDDVSVRKLVEKHSDLIRNSSPPGNMDSSSTFFSVTSASLIGENLVSNSVATNGSDEFIKGDGSSSFAIPGNCPEYCGLEPKADGSIKPTDIVQPGIVKRQSKLFSQLDSENGKQNTEKLQADSVEDPREDKVDNCKEKIDYLVVEDSEKNQRSNRGCVKELLRQMEGKCDLETQQPASYDFQSHEHDLDTEVQSFMHSAEADSNGQNFPETNLMPESQDESEVDSQTGSQISCKISQCKPNKDVLKIKSAPVSPKLSREEPSRTHRSSSLGNARVPLLPPEAPTEVVKSLVDRFEIGDLTS